MLRNVLMLAIKITFSSMPDTRNILIWRTFFFEIRLIIEEFLAF